MWPNSRYPFYKFSYTIGLSYYLAKFQSITNITTRVFWTFISENLLPPLIFLVPIHGWKLDKMTSFSFSQKYRTDWNNKRNKCGKLHEYKFLFFFVRIAILIVIYSYSNCYLLIVIYTNFQPWIGTTKIMAALNSWK